MSERISYPPPSAYPAGLPLINVFRMWSHSPALLPHLINFGKACFQSVSINELQRELCILLCAQKLNCEYQWIQHLPIARRSDVREEHIKAIELGNITDETVFSEQEKALLGFLNEVLDKPEIDEQVLAETRKYLDDKAIVEILAMQGFYYTLARTATVLGVGLEVTSAEDLQKVVDNI